MLHYLTDSINSIRKAQVEGRHLPAIEVSDGAEVHCLNCGTHYVGNYCPNCGQKSTVKRLTIKQGLLDLLNVFTNFDSGFFHTCLELCYRPGYMIRDYISGHRKEYFKPLQLLFLLGTILLVLHFLFYRQGFNSGMEIDPEMIKQTGHPRVVEMMLQCLEWLISNRAVLYLIVVTLMVLPNWLCFKWVPKPMRLNVSEHFFTMAYIGCQLLMLDIVSEPFRFFNQSSGGYSLGVPLLLLIWDFSQLFRIGIRRTIRLCLCSSSLTLTLFILLVLAGALSVLLFIGEINIG